MALRRKLAKGAGAVVRPSLTFSDCFPIHKGGDTDSSVSPLIPSRDLNPASSNEAAKFQSRAGDAGKILHNVSDLRISKAIPKGAHLASLPDGSGAQASPRGRQFVGCQSEPLTDTLAKGRDSLPTLAALPDAPAMKPGAPEWMRQCLKRSRPTSRIFSNGLVCFECFATDAEATYLRHCGWHAATYVADAIVCTGAAKIGAYLFERNVWASGLVEYRIFDSADTFQNVSFI